MNEAQRCFDRWLTKPQGSERPGGKRRETAVCGPVYSESLFNAVLRLLKSFQPAAARAGWRTGRDVPWRAAGRDKVHKRRRWAGCLLAGGLAVADAWAGSPPAPGEVEEAVRLQPEVTIIKRGPTEIQEYRINGELYMIKVVPAKGRPYYLVDADGDGRLETHRQNDLLIPAWTIFRWK